MRFVIGRFFERIRGALAELRPGSLLDVGCGEGELLRRGIFANGPAPVCVDLNAGALAELRGATGHAPLVCASVASLPFAARSFDAVMCLEVLEHLENPAAAVRELARVARKALILSVPYEPYFRIGNVIRGKHLRHLGNFPEHVQHWNRRTFEGFLSSVLNDVRVVEAFPWVIASCRPNCR